MNFNKNYYKLCLPSLMASAAIILLGVAFALIFGFNTTAVNPCGLGGIIIYLSIYLLATSVFQVVYLRIRFNWSTGFVVILKNFVDIILLICLIAIVRVPLTLLTVLSCVVTTLFGNVVALILLVKANKLLQTETNHKDLSNKLIAENILGVIILALAVIVVNCMLLGTGLNLISFALCTILGIIVAGFTSLFILVPVWLGFVKRELRIKEKAKKLEKSDKVVNEIKEETNIENATTLN